MIVFIIHVHTYGHGTNKDNTTPNAFVLPPAHTRWLCTHIGNFYSGVEHFSSRESSTTKKNRGKNGRLDDVPYGLARTISSNLYCQKAAGIGFMGVEHVAVCSKCMERAMQMFYGN